ncbi:nickel-dependent hydrogenase large subunit [Cellulosilyticum sp. I15G10I2]|uniref:nickel-dependent hydrogenase large subunit n=1 Tax=Cellulosilyticum sp. I15G10I2 TaxID=1892843 RepID=UPI00085CB22A|nr:nickel-dependent hydrogenase large subunit [Cellulosilyticum sp. I15G10I2]
MARTEIKIDPISRVSGLLEISVEIENNVVVDARSSGMQFRGFEDMFRGRPPLDMPYLTARTCGICSTHHTLASTLALEAALGVTPSVNGIIVRELANGFELLQNHIRHMYQFVLPDYVNLEGVNPLQKTSPATSDFRLPREVNTRLAANYYASLPFSRKAHTAIAVLAGKAPHPHGIFVGGTTTNISIMQYNDVRSILNEISVFVDEVLIPNMFTIADYYNDYYQLGDSYKNFLSERLFAEDNFPITYTLGGVLIDDELEPLDTANILESLRYTWLDAPNDIIPPGNDAFTPNADKPDAYSWVTAPRYRGYAMEVGPLARMYISGIYTRGTSAMDRNIARALETQKICEVMKGLLEILRLEPAMQRRWEIPQTASGMSIVAAARGTLMHFVEIEDALIKSYKLIPPSNWNMSPKDNNNIRGAAEEALMGTPIADPLNPVEIGRIVRSFDPCLNCAAHVTSDRHAPLTIQII